MGNRFREKVVEEGLEEPQVVEEPIEAEAAVVQETPKENHRGDKAARGIGRVLGGDVLADRWVLKQIPLVLLCLFYLLLIVGNRYRVENYSREKIEHPELAAFEHVDGSERIESASEKRA